MREISNTEIQNVAGGLSSAAIGASLGYSIGSVVDGAYNSITGLHSTAQTSAGAILGAGVGYIVDAAHSTSAQDITSNVGKAITGIGFGSIGIISGFVGGLKTIFGKRA